MSWVPVLCESFYTLTLSPVTLRMEILVDVHALQNQDFIKYHGNHT